MKFDRESSARTLAYVGHVGGQTAVILAAIGAWAVSPGWWAVSLTVLALVGGALWLTRRNPIPGRRRRAVAGVWLALGAIGAVGVVTQRTHDGGVVVVGSERDEILRALDMLDSDLERLVAWDELSGTDNADAQALERARTAAQLLADDTAARFATPVLDAAAQRIRLSARSAQKALELREELNLEFSVPTAEFLTQHRAELAQHAVEARRLLDIARQAD